MRCRELRHGSRQEALSEDALSLIRRTLSRDPATRLSSAEVVDMDWFRAMGSQASLRPSMCSEKVLRTLHSYTNLSDLERASMYHVAYNVEDMEARP